MENESLAGFIGRRLREIRLMQRLRQEDLTEKGISYKYYQRIEAGRVNLTLRSLERLASAFGITVFDLFRRTKQKRALQKRAGAEK